MSTQIVITADDKHALVLGPQPLLMEPKKEAADKPVEIHKFGCVKLMLNSDGCRIVRRFEFSGETNNVDAVLLSDGHLVVPKGDTLQLYDTNGKLLRVLTQEGPKRRSSSLTASPNARYVVADYTELDGACGMMLWDIQQGTSVCLGKSQGLNQASFSPDGQHMVSVEWAGEGDACQMKLWDIRRGQMVRAFVGKGLSQRINTVRFSPDGRWLVSGEVGALRLWDVRSGREVRSFIDRRREAMFHAMLEDLLEDLLAPLHMGDFLFLLEEHSASLKVGVRAR